MIMQSLATPITHDTMNNMYLTISQLLHPCGNIATPINKQIIINPLIYKHMCHAHPLAIFNPSNSTHF